MFGYKNHIGIDKAHGLIRTWVPARPTPMMVRDCRTWS
jgi:hypothetical protein